MTLGKTKLAKLTDVSKQKNTGLEAATSSNGAAMNGCPVLELSESDLTDFAMGAAFLGAGGGGDPYIGQLMAKHAIREFGHPMIIDADSLPDDATVVMVGMLGAPTVLTEKAAAGPDIDLAIQRMSERLGRPIDALMPIEIGGVNSTVPIVASARSGLPLLNADGMGRAFPEIQMVVMNFEGLSATPFVIVDEHLNSAIVDTKTAPDAEAFVRTIAVHMGLSCMVTGYPMTGAESKRATVRNTLSVALDIGRSIVRGRRTGDPVGELIGALCATDIYGYAREIFDGKLIDLQRDTATGFSVGQAEFEGLSDPQRRLLVKFQNEYLIALENDALRAVVPDLIAIVDRETAEPIPVEALRYGQRVKVLAVAAPKIITTPQALASVSPRCFGLDVDYQPIRSLAGGAS